MTNVISNAAGKVAHKVGEVEMSRRSFLKIGLITTLGAYDAMTGVTDKLNELNKPSLIDRVMDVLNFDFVDKACAKFYLFDLKMKRIIWLVKWVESRFGLGTK